MIFSYPENENVAAAIIPENENVAAAIITI